MRLTITGLLATILIFFIIQTNLNAQFESYDLSSYNLPDFNRQEFDVSLDSYGGFDNHDKRIASPIDYELETKSNRIRIWTYLDYMSLSNSQKKQELLNSRLRLNGSIVNQDGYDYLSEKSTAFNLDGYINYSNRVYNKKKMFFESGIIANYLLEKDKFKDADSSFVLKRKYNSHILTGHIPIKIGYGRLEQVEDARQAIYIIDELRKENRIIRDISHDEVTQFAKFISALKRERFFDYRLRRIDNLEAIDSFLQVNNYLNEADARYFSTLLDMWDYGASPLRESGSRLSIAIIPGYYLSAYKSEKTDTILNINESNYHGYTLNSGLEYRYAKPINLYWQNSFGISGYFGIASVKFITKENEHEHQHKFPNIFFDVFHSLGYYPNTRTTLNLYSSVGYTQLIDATDEKKDILGVDSKSFRGSTSLRLKYYFSPRLSFGAITSFAYKWNESLDNTLVHFSSVYGSMNLFRNFQHIGQINNTKRSEKESSFGFSIELTYSLF